MSAYSIPEDRWSFKLAPQLVGKAQQAYAAMNPDEAGNYEQLKAAILRRYGINEEGYRQRFRQARKKQEESNKEFATRLQDLTNKWMQECTSMEELKDHIVMEQLIDTLPSAVRIYVKEHKPKTSEEAGELADDYIQARGFCWDSTNEQSWRTGTPRLCHTCGKPGHLMKDCPTNMGVGSQKEIGSAKKFERPKKNMKEVECFNCRRKGHYSANCPHNAMFCRPQEGATKAATCKVGVMRTGVIEGKPVSNILLDTGCSQTLVHRDLVPPEKLLEGRAITICCAHGDTAIYPLAKVGLEIEGKHIEVEAGVADRLPMGALLGTDVPQLKNLLWMTRMQKRWLSMPWWSPGKLLKRKRRQRKFVNKKRVA